MKGKLVLLQRLDSYVCHYKITQVITLFLPKRINLTLLAPSTRGEESSILYINF